MSELQNEMLSSDTPMPDPGRRSPSELADVPQSVSTALPGGGEMGARMRALDWSKTPVGPVEKWPQSLRSTLSMLLPSKAQIILFWGREFVVFYNDAYRPVFGAKHPRTLGMPGREAWSEIWDRQLHELLAGVVQTGDAFNAKDLLFVIERHGFVEETYFDVSYDPVRDESGAVGGVFCIVTETTGRVVGERRLALLRDLAARNAAARTTRDACAVAMDTLAGRQEDVPFALVFLGNELQASTPGAIAALETTPSRYVRELPIVTGASGLTGKLVIGLNARRPFDDQYRAFLELVAGQLATTIGNAKAYEDARERAEALAELDRAKTAFFSNVSHEFRTPITLLLGPVAELLATGGRSETDRRALELIERNGLRLLKLVNTLLDFSRIEAGRVQARFVPTDLAALTAELASAFRSTIERAGLRLRVECKVLAEQLYVDREMWEKIVLNLLSNAFKHTFEGEIAVRVRAEDGRAVVSVADTGIGIPAESLTRVFDRFHQVPAARSRTHEGSGIGLSLVRELVHLHGATITVRSVLDRGSVFEIRIPFGTAHLPAEHVSHDPSVSVISQDDTIVEPFVREALRWSGSVDESLVSRALADAGAVLVGARVLVVDDNADMRDYLTRLLVEGGAKLTAAVNGRDALERLRDASAELPDVVLSDVMMPELDGFGLLNAMRADDRLKAIPFIVLSARAGEESRIGGLAAGADDYLIKPFVARELIARVASQLRLARASQSERQAHAEAEVARTQMSRVFEQAPVPICVFEGRDLVYTSANASYRQLIGNRDPVGKGLLELWPELNDSEMHRVFQQVLDTGEARSATEFRIQFDQFGSGQLVDSWFNFVYHPLHDATGATTGIIAVATDVTPQVVARREAEGLRAAAEAANEAKVHLLRTVSHETRQPVHASLGYLDLLTLGLRGDVTPEQRNDLEAIKRNQTHLLGLLNDILSFAKLEAGALELDFEDADATYVLTSVEPLVGPQFQAKGVTYSSTPFTERARFHGDIERSVQVCVNLLTNALKATPAGGSVTLSCSLNEKTVDIFVRDTGIGIPSSKLEVIFDPFTQLARVRSDAGGVGLGLSISRQLARAMGGDVTVESEVGVGSTFTFSLPRAY